MKTKFVSLIASAFAFAAFTAHAETTLSVAATAVPHAEILDASCAAFLIMMRIITRVRWAPLRFRKT